MPGICADVHGFSDPVDQQPLQRHAPTVDRFSLVLKSNRQPPESCARRSMLRRVSVPRFEDQLRRVRTGGFEPSPLSPADMKTGPMGRHYLNGEQRGYSRLRRSPLRGRRAGRGVPRRDGHGCRGSIFGATWSNRRVLITSSLAGRQEKRARRALCSCLAEREGFEPSIRQ